MEDVSRPQQLQEQLQFHQSAVSDGLGFDVDASAQRPRIDADVVAEAAASDAEPDEPVPRIDRADVAEDDDGGRSSSGDNCDGVRVDESAARRPVAGGADGGGGGSPRQEKYDELLALIESQRVELEVTGHVDSGIDVEDVHTPSEAGSGQQSSVSGGNSDVTATDLTASMTAAETPPMTTPSPSQGAAAAAAVAGGDRPSSLMIDATPSDSGNTSSTERKKNKGKVGLKLFGGRGQKPTTPTNDAVDGGDLAVDVDISPEIEAQTREISPGLRFEVKQKRHVIEEIVIEDSEKYYESLTKRKSKRSSRGSDVVVVSVEPAAVAERQLRPIEVSVDGAQRHGVDVEPTSGSPPIVVAEPSGTKGEEVVVKYVVDYDVSAPPATGKRSSRLSADVDETPAGVRTPDVDVGGRSVGNVATVAAECEPETVTYVVEHNLPMKKAKGADAVVVVAERKPKETTSEQPEIHALPPSLTLEAEVPDKDGPQSITYVVNYEVAAKKSRKGKKKGNKKKRGNRKGIPKEEIETTGSAAIASTSGASGHIEGRVPDSLYLAILDIANRSADDDSRVTKVTYITHHDHPSLKLQKPSVTVSKQPPEPVAVSVDTSEKLQITPPPPVQVRGPDIPERVVEVDVPVAVEVNVEPEVKTPLIKNETETVEFVVSYDVSTQKSPEAVGDVDIPDVAVRKPSPEPEPAVIVAGTTKLQSDVSTVTYIVQYDWPTPKLKKVKKDVNVLRVQQKGQVTHADIETPTAKTEPVGVSVAASSDVTSTTYITHGDWPQPKAKGSGKAKVVNVPKQESQVVTVGVSPMVLAEAAEEPTAVSVSEPPPIGVGGPPGNVMSRTYVVHYDWPQPKVKISGKVKAPKGQQEGQVVTVGVRPEVDVTHEAVAEPGDFTDKPSGEVTSHTFVVHYDWPQPKVKASGKVKAVNVPKQESQNVTVGVTPLVVAETSEIAAEPTPASVGEPTPVVVSESPGDDVTSRTYIVHYDWPQPKVKVSGKVKVKGQQEGRAAVTGSGDVTLETAAEAEPRDVTDEPSASGEATSHTFIVHCDWPQPKVKKSAKLKTVSVPKQESQVVTVDVNPSAVTEASGIVAEPAQIAVEPSAGPDALSKTYVVHYDWPQPKVKASGRVRAPKGQKGVQGQATVTVDVSPAVEVTPGAVAATPTDVTDMPSGDVTAHTFIVHYDWPQPKVKASGKVKAPKGKKGVQGPAAVTVDVSPAVEVMPGAVAATPTDVTEIPSGDVAAHTFIVHYDWPQPKRKMKAAKDRGSAEVAAEVNPDRPDLDVAATVPLPRAEPEVETVTIETRYDVSPPTVDVRLPEGPPDVEPRPSALTAEIEGRTSPAVVVVKEPKLSLTMPEAEGADSETITFIVNYDHPWNVQRSAVKAGKRGKAARGLQAKTEKEVARVSVEAGTGEPHPEDSEAVTYIVHFDLPSKQAKSKGERKKGVPSPAAQPPKVLIEGPAPVVASAAIPEEQRPLPVVVSPIIETDDKTVTYVVNYEPPSRRPKFVGKKSDRLQPITPPPTREETPIDLERQPPPAAVAAAAVAVGSAGAVKSAAPGEETVTYVVTYEVEPKIRKKSPRAVFAFRRRPDTAEGESAGRRQQEKLPVAAVPEVKATIDVIDIDAEAAMATAPKVPGTAAQVIGATPEVVVTAAPAEKIEPKSVTYVVEYRPTPTLRPGLAEHDDDDDVEVLSPTAAADDAVDMGTFRPARGLRVEAQRSESENRDYEMEFVPAPSLELEVGNVQDLSLSIPSLTIAAAEPEIVPVMVPVAACAPPPRHLLVEGAGGGETVTFIVHYGPPIKKKFGLSFSKRRRRTEGKQIKERRQKKTRSLPESDVAELAVTPMPSQQQEPPPLQLEQQHPTEKVRTESVKYVVNFDLPRRKTKGSGRSPNKAAEVKVSNVEAIPELEEEQVTERGVVPPPVQPTTVEAAGDASVTPPVKRKGVAVSTSPPRQPPTVDRRASTPAQDGPETVIYVVHHDQFGRKKSTGATKKKKSRLFGRSKSDDDDDKRRMFTVELTPEGVRDEESVVVITAATATAAADVDVAEPQIQPTAAAPVDAERPDAGETADSARVLPPPPPPPVVDPSALAEIPAIETVTYIVRYDDDEEEEESDDEKPLTAAIRQPTSASAPSKDAEERIMMRPIDDDVVGAGAVPDVGRSDVEVSSDADAAVAGRLVAAPPQRHFVVVAIDFGTTFSGYAFSFASPGEAVDDEGNVSVQPPGSVHVMRRWEGGDPGVVNHKTPTTILLTPGGEFHSFGFTARDFYHDLSPRQAKKWLYFEKFKMVLHNDADVNSETELSASNGQRVLALTIFSYALRFFRKHAVQEMSDQSGTKIVRDDIRWVITVPSIWREPAKQFMRQAAYQAGIASPDRPDQLVISLEPEAASIYVRRLHLHQLVPEGRLESLHPTPRSPRSAKSATPEPRPLSGEFTFQTESSPHVITQVHWSFPRQESPVYSVSTVADQVDIPGTRYMVVDCGGGTVDITVHELSADSKSLIELFKATGGPFGSTAVDAEFERLLVGVFGADFIDVFKAKRPAGWVDLMMAFESRKRAANPLKSKALNVSLPFSFIDHHKKYRNYPVETAIRRYGDSEVLWSSQGMLRLLPGAMRRLFQPTLDHIKLSIGNVLNHPSVRGLKFMFLVGGFAESPMLQMEICNEFQHLLKIIIPHEVSLAVLRGAVFFGVNPDVVSTRRSLATYGVGVVRPFVRGSDPDSKLLRRDSSEWCADVFDALVLANQPVGLGQHAVVRRYAPAALPAAGSSPRRRSNVAVFDVFCTDRVDVRYTTDSGVKQCGRLRLDFGDDDDVDEGGPAASWASREVQLRLNFSSTEVTVSAVDTRTGRCVHTNVDFLTR